MPTNNPGIRTKVMDMLKGFRTIDKVLNAATDVTGEIEACMICQATADGAGSAGVVTLAKGYDGTGVPYIALNNYFDVDAMSMTYSTQGTGSGVGSRIIGIPLTVAGELVITLDKLTEADTDAYTVGDLVTAAAAATGLINKAIALESIVGQVTEVRADAIVIYPLANAGAA